MVEGFGGGGGGGGGGGTLAFFFSPTSLYCQLHNYSESGAQITMNRAFTTLIMVSRGSIIRRLRDKCTHELVNHCDCQS